jgi:hypothetical protein
MHRIFTVKQTQTIQGGTGRFFQASGAFAGTLTGAGADEPATPTAAATPSRGPLVELDTFAITGSLAF